MSFSWVRAFDTDLKKALEQLPGLVVASWEESDKAWPETDSESGGDCGSSNSGSSSSDGEGNGEQDVCQHQESKKSEDDDEDDDSYLYKAHMREKRPCSLCSRR